MVTTPRPDKFNHDLKSTNQKLFNIDKKERRVARANRLPQKLHQINKSSKSYTTVCTCNGV